MDHNSSSGSGPSEKPKGKWGGSRTGTSRSGAAATANTSGSGHNIDSSSAADPVLISTGEFMQLNEQLEFITENDEHADIATGDRIIDESLIDDVSDSTDANAEAAEAETRSAQPVQNSALHNYLIRTCSTFMMSGSGFRTCSQDAQIALSVPVTNHYPGMVNEQGCGKSHRGTDPHIIAQLPRFVQEAFPAYISARGAISKLMMRQMANTFASRFGPAPFSDLVSEFQHRSHAESELMYLAAANFYSRHNPAPFSAFNDPNGYAGVPPSVKYLKALFTDYTAAHRIFIEREIGTLPLDAAKADHTHQDFKTYYIQFLKYMEVRGHSLTPTKSLGFVKDMYEGIQQGLKDSGNQPTQVLWTDKPPSGNKTEQQAGNSVKLDIIQLRTKDKIFILKQTLLTISRAFSLPEIESTLKLKNAPILDLGKYAKLKAIVEYPAISRHALAASEYSEFLLTEIDCVWRIYLSLRNRDSLGLPLQPIEAVTHGQLVTLVQACKPIVEGSIIGNHNGYLDALMDDNNHRKKINVSSSRSLIHISKLHTRGETRPLPSGALNRAFSVPAPPIISNENADLTLSYSAPPLKFDHWSADLDIGSDEEGDSDDETDDSTDQHGQFAFQVQPQTSAETDGIDHDLLGPDIDSNSPVDILMEGIRHAHSLLDDGTLPSRVLDDVHFMDQLLRLLSKKHSAFKAFAHDFSEAIFIEMNLTNLLFVLFSRSMESIGNMQSVLMRGSQPPNPALFDGYADIHCSTKKTRGSFFSDEAKEMVERLLKTVRKGYLSDPPGISLYHLMGKDRDSLNIYRTIRGTNSIEGGFHMVVHRIFGSLRASPELAECLLLNWINCRNKKVGFRNCSGKEFQGHFDTWLRDKIVELAIAIGVKPSFPLPRVLSTRIATSKSIGILPISASLAEQLKMTILPRSRVIGVPHYRDLPVATMTRLSTKPTNQYRYLQLQQRTLSAVLPVHTHKEYLMFKAHIIHPKFRKAGRLPAPHDHWKIIHFLKFAQFWNELVDSQPPTLTDSNQRLHYKLPIQLEVHHK
ncbi:hypothetical protein C8R43DRAFT_945485 [Mycena crocata]|nr:hypothetical protein C8R43DRAFT_945485 [Mycena crocata]